MRLPREHEHVHGADGVAEVLGGVPVERDVPLMKGVDEEIAIYRVRPVAGTV
jgi:hypothetical protein